MRSLQKQKRLKERANKLKTCRVCLETKPLSSFYKRKANKDGYDYLCKTCGVKESRKRYQENPDYYKSISKNFYTKNKEKCKAQHNRWVDENKDYILSYAKVYKKDNRALATSWERVRKGITKKAMPKWANTFFIEEIYALAKLRTKLLGIDFQVDHIIPLRGALVCGLHVENNLQILTKKDNLKKSNKYA